MSEAAGGATFDAGWLALREPVDHRSRAGGAFLDPLRDAWTAGGGSRVLDLGSGTGSNLRWLAPRLPGPQRWVLLDHDSALLERATAPAEGVEVVPVVGDLTGAGPDAVAGAHLVTASALLDLGGAAWLEALVAACRKARAGALFALTYDGRVAWSPGRPDDALVLEAVNAHQRRDKGLGPALGPAATATAEALFRRADYRVWLRPSPWRLGPADASLARALVDGWESAALEARPERAGRVRAWAAARRTDVAAGGWTLEVGHADLLALPTDAPDGGGRG